MDVLLAIILPLFHTWLEKINLLQLQSFEHEGLNICEFDARQEQGNSE